MTQDLSDALQQLHLHQRREYNTALVVCGSGERIRRKVLSYAMDKIILKADIVEGVWWPLSFYWNEQRSRYEYGTAYLDFS